jgi:hypothetical protein
MKTSFNPALSFDTTSVVPIKPSKSEARVASFAGHDSFVNSKHKLAGILVSGGMGIKTGAAVIIMSLASLFSCKDITDIKPDGMKVYSSLPLDKQWEATLDSLGFFGETGLKSANSGTEVRYIDTRSGGDEVFDIVIDKTKSTAEKLIGTKTLSYEGEKRMTYDIEITRNAEGTGVDMAHFVNGQDAGIRTYVVSEGSVKHVGIKDFQFGKLKWILRPVDDKKISAKFIENGDEISVERFLTIL